VLDWFERNHKAISAISAGLTALLAFAALIGVKVQIDGAARIQQEQSARDIYREYLNLSVQKPEFAAPDYCVISKTNQLAAYQAYVDYLLYTGEQVLSVDPDWEETIDASLKPHAAYLCEAENEYYPDSDVEALVTKLRTAECAKVTPCQLQTSDFH
jgi:hypothetical protein